MPAPSILLYGGRFKLWDRPAVYPQVDLVNRAPEGPVFDLGVTTEDDGGVYLRAEHVEEMAGMLGWKSPEEVEALVAENDSLKNQINNMPNATEELKDGIDNCIRDFYERLDYRPAVEFEVAEAVSGDSEESESGSSEPDPDSLESFGLGSSEGPNELSGHSGNGKSGKSK